MPRNGSGTYSLPQPPFVAGTVISSAAVNSDLSDIANALTASLPRDGQVGMQGQLKSTDGSTAVPGITFSNDLTTGFSRSVSGSSQIGVSIGGVSVGLFTTAGWTGAVTGPVTGNGSVPIGLVLPFAGVTVPSFWVLCAGQNVSRSTYAALFTVIGTIYGAGDGSTTFGVPDLRGRVPFGRDNMGGSASGRLTTTFFGNDPTGIGDGGGSQSHTLIPNEIPTLSALNNNAPSYTVNQTNGFQPVENTNSPGVNIAAGGVNVEGINPNNRVAMTIVSSVNIAGSTLSTSTNNTGSGAHTIVNPGLILNYLMYAGV